MCSGRCSIRRSLCLITDLLGLRILQAVKNAAIHHGETKSDYISKTDLFGYVCAMGFERRAVALWLDTLLKRALRFNYDPACLNEESATQLEISSTGEWHLYWGQREYEYLFAVAETTPIRDEPALRRCGLPTMIDGTTSRVR